MPLVQSLIQKKISTREKTSAGAMQSACSSTTDLVNLDAMSSSTSASLASTRNNSLNSGLSNLDVSSTQLDLSQVAAKLGARGGEKVSCHDTLLDNPLAQLMQIRSQIATLEPPPTLGTPRSVPSPLLPGGTLASLLQRFPTNTR